MNKAKRPTLPPYTHASGGRECTNDEAKRPSLLPHTGTHQEGGSVRMNKAKRPTLPPYTHTHQEGGSVLMTKPRNQAFSPILTGQARENVYSTVN